MKRALLLILTSSAIALGTAGPLAQTQPPKQGPNQATDKGKDAGASAVGRASQATELITYARQNQSAVAMLTAVQMLRAARVADSKDRPGAKSTEAAKGATPTEGKKASPSEATLDPVKLLNEAKGWAKGNAQLTALIDAELAKPAAQGGTLGAAGGPIRHVDRVRAFDTDVYRVTFRGGELAHVDVVGDGDTDLDVYIYDENGNLIDRDTDYDDRPCVMWTPRWTGTFVIKIQNLGRVYNQYTVFTN
jgi:hypothetical protein